MHRTLRHHGYTTGCSLWVVITVTLGLALGQQATAATECARATLLPAEVHLIAPGAEVPEAVARFAGVWVGDGSTGVRRCATRWSSKRSLQTAMPGSSTALVPLPAGISVSPRFWCVTGRIVDGTLHFHLPEPDRPELAYQFAGEALQGTFKGERRVRLTRVADIRQVGCGPAVRDVPQRHPPTGHAIG